MKDMAITGQELFCVGRLETPATFPLLLSKVNVLMAFHDHSDAITKSYLTSAF